MKRNSNEMMDNIISEKEVVVNGSSFIYSICKQLQKQKNQNDY